MYELVDFVFSWRWVECISWLVLFQLEVSGVYELIDFIFRGGCSVRVDWFCF